MPRLVGTVQAAQGWQQCMLSPAALKREGLCKSDMASDPCFTRACSCCRLLQRMSWRGAWASPCSPMGTTDWAGS